MGENNKLLTGLLAAVAFIICIALVVLGQRKLEALGLIMEIGGLLGILGLLYLYNKKYQ